MMEFAQQPFTTSKPAMKAVTLGYCQP